MHAKELAATLRREHAKGLIAFMPDTIDAALLRDAPSLRAVACAMKGTDNVNVKACAEAGVQLWREEHALTEPTAELALALALSLLRRIPEGDARVRSGAFKGWRPELYSGTLHGSHVGIYGFGAVGRAVFHRIVPFGPSAVSFVSLTPSRSRRRCHRRRRRRRRHRVDYPCTVCHTCRTSCDTAT